jgi:hypothetical protein
MSTFGEALNRHRPLRSTPRQAANVVAMTALHTCLRL